MVSQSSENLLSSVMLQTHSQLEILSTKGGAQAPWWSHATNLSHFFCSHQGRRTVSVLIPWITIGGWWVQLGWAAFLCRHLGAEPLYAQHFWHKTSGEMSLFLSQEHRGTKLVASARSSTAVNTHKRISPPEIQISSCTLTLTLVTLQELTSESKNSQPEAEASCNQESSGCC